MCSRKPSGWSYTIMLAEWCSSSTSTLESAKPMRSTSVFRNDSQGSMFCQASVDDDLLNDRKEGAYQPVQTDRRGKSEEDEDRKERAHVHHIPRDLLLGGKRRRGVCPLRHCQFGLKELRNGCQSYHDN